MKISLLCKWQQSYLNLVADQQEGFQGIGTFFSFNFFLHYKIKIEKKYAAK
jgi:hypothetical protein